MAKEKVTLTLDAEQLGELRTLVGARSLSATVDIAVAAHLAKLRHLQAVDEWLAELERDHGPVPPETLEWAAQVIDRWSASEGQASRRAG
ncbi:MAG: CopG family transcriptional regulator [Acidimicrobiia bacterium]|nr:CopG family transcriptional regulator [Acidimicrobiia bacterium]